MRILHLTNYPTVNPIHGGQIRASQITSHLRNAGHDVMPLSIFVAGNYQEFSDDDICFKPNSKIWNCTLPWLSDYYTGIYAANDTEIISRLTGVFKKFKPHIIIFEQPWLFSLAKKIAISKTTKLIYSSQNIEWKLKDKLFDRNGIKNKGELVSEIKNNEIDAVSYSNLTIACTSQDADYYKESTGLNNIIVAGNGVEPFSCTDERVEEWRVFLKNPTAVFVSSAHLPNAQGFWDMMRPGLNFLKAGEKILVIGGVCNIITAIKDFEEYSELNSSRLNLAGLREKTELQALVKASHVVLLPISDGEGSNLKTAEALESGCFIIGTTKAFRGFEAAMNLPNVTIADNPVDFRKSIRRILNSSQNFDATPMEIREKFYWKNQLYPLVNAINSI